MLTVSEIKTFIDNDIASTKKRLAKVGERYYNADHDIKNYRIFYIDGNGQLKEDKTKSNVKICHPFFAELVDQETQYILSGKEGFVKSDIPELQEELDATDLIELPVLEDYLSKRALKDDQIKDKLGEFIYRFYTIVAKPGENGLQIKITTSEMMDEEVNSRAFEKDVIVYRWNGKRFVLSKK